MWQSLIQSRVHNKHTSLNYNTGFLWHNSGAQQWNRKKHPEGKRKAPAKEKTRLWRVRQHARIHQFCYFKFTLSVRIMQNMCANGKVWHRVWHDVKVNRWAMKTANVQETSSSLAVEHQYCLKWFASPLMTRVWQTRSLRSLKQSFQVQEGKKM